MEQYVKLIIILSIQITNFFITIHTILIGFIFMYVFKTMTLLMIEYTKFTKISFSYMQKYQYLYKLTNFPIHIHNHVIHVHM